MTFNNKPDPNWIRENYPSFKMFRSLYTQIFYREYVDCNELNEMLNTSVNSSLLYKLVKKKDHVNLISDFEYIEEDNTFRLILNNLTNVYKYNKTNINNIINQASILGWNCSYYYIYDLDDNVIDKNSFNKLDYNELEYINLHLIFEANYDIEVDISEYDNLYHITFDIFYYGDRKYDNSRKINRIGLTPKTKSKLSDYPSRIYLLTNSQYTHDLADALYSKIDDKVKDEIYKVIILKIDTKKLKNYKFYNDPNMYDAVWTYKNITPSMIEIENEYSIEELTSYHKKI